MTVRYFYETPRGWSQWMEWAERTKFSCCGCGLTHRVQVRLEHTRTTRAGVRLFRMEVRMKTDHKRTAARRKMRRYKGLVLPKKRGS